MTWGRNSVTNCEFKKVLMTNSRLQVAKISGDFLGCSWRIERINGDEAKNSFYYKTPQMKCRREVKRAGGLKH